MAADFYLCIYLLLHRSLARGGNATTVHCLLTHVSVDSTVHVHMQKHKGSLIYTLTDEDKHTDEKTHKPYCYTQCVCGDRSLEDECFSH